MSSPVVMEMQILEQWAPVPSQTVELGHHMCACKSPKRSLKGPCYILLFLLLLLLKLPLLVFVSWDTPRHLGVRAALCRAVHCDARVRMRVVDGPVLQVFKERV